jgi:hypothetical protein
MPRHGYNAEDALKLLLRKVGQIDRDLAVQLHAAINEGKDIRETEYLAANRVRTYRRKLPYTHEEALQVALQVLNAYFIQQPQFANSVHDDLFRSALGTPRQSRSSRTIDELVPASSDNDKAVSIELRTETELTPGDVVTGAGEDMQNRGRVPASTIEEQLGNLARLAELTSFED